jgi:hypothetical protein
MASTQHYVWAGGHFVLLLASFKVLFAAATFSRFSPFWYKTSYIGALISYAIVCHKSLGTPSPNPAYFKKALADENFQYFLLAFFWFTGKPVTMSLIPFAIFSLFHALTFTRTTLMPQFLPPTPPAQAGGNPTPHPLARKLQIWVKANYDKAMKAVAYAELAILVRVILGALTFQNSLLTPIFFAHFVRARYYQSAFTRGAVSEAQKAIEARLAQPGIPPVANQVWTQFKFVVNRWAGATLEPAQPAAAAAAQ